VPLAVHAKCRVVRVAGPGIRHSVSRKPAYGMSILSVVDDIAVGSDERRPRITEHATPPRGLARRQRAQRWAGGLAAIGCVIYLVGTSRNALAVVAVPGILVGLIAVWVRFVTRRRRRGDLYWTGFVSFVEDDFADTALFPHITRTPRKSLGRSGLSGGKLKVEARGLSWLAGSLATPRCEISGAFFLPWSSIVRVDIGDIPGKFNAIGGYVRFTVAGDASELYGEFLGSRGALLEGLRRTPLGSG